MPKYKVKMNYVEAKVAEFIVEAKDSDEVHELLGEIDMDFIEENAGFYTVDYEPPIIEECEATNTKKPVHEKIQRAMDEVRVYLES